MKIVHVIASIDPEGGGLQAVAMRMAAAQSGANEVHLLSYGSDQVRAKVSEIGGSIPGFAAVRLNILPAPDKFERLLCRRGKRALRDVLTRGSFVHIHGVWEPFLLQAARIASASRIPYCVSPAGMLDLWEPETEGLEKEAGIATELPQNVGAREFHPGAQQR